MTVSFTIAPAEEEGYYVTSQGQIRHEFQNVLFAGELGMALAFIQLKFSEMEENEREIREAERKQREEA